MLLSVPKGSCLGGMRNDDKRNFGLEFLSFGLLMSMILLAV
jgi:hypothetical protein